MKFVAIAGTNKTGSINRKLIDYITDRYRRSEAGEDGPEVSFETLDIAGLPIFSKVAEEEVPPQVKDLAAAIESSDGVVFATPEYDHAVPAVLMNALAWLSYGIHPFYNKPVMIVGASYGNLGTSRAQLHLRRILDAPELHAFVLPSSEFLVDHSLQAFDDDGNLIDSGQVAKLDSLFRSFLEFAQASKAVTPRAYEKEEMKRYVYVSDPDSPVYGR